MKEEIEQMIDTGVNTSVTEPTEWCAGIVVVSKKDGKGRLCVDYTHLNNSVLRKRHMLPVVDEVLAKFAGAKIFSKLDAKSGIWQILLKEQLKKLTTFISLEGRFCFDRLPFRISSASKFFQRKCRLSLGTWWR